MPDPFAEINVLGCAPLEAHAHLRQLLCGRRVRGRRRIAGPPATLPAWEEASRLQDEVQGWLR